MKKPVEVSSEWQRNYETFYEDHVDSEWRTLCAADKTQNIIDLCGAVPHDTILEIGAGTGAVLAGLANAGFGKSWGALEVAATAVEAIKNRRDTRLTAEIYDGYHVPREDQSVDLIVLSHVVEHLEHPRILLAEAARVARHVFVEVPLEDTLRLGWDFTPNHVGHINFYTPRSIRHLLQTSGLVVHEQRVTLPSAAVYVHSSGQKGRLIRGVKAMLNRVAPRVAPHLMTYHCAMLASLKQ